MTHVMVTQLKDYLVRRTQAADVAIAGTRIDTGYGGLSPRKPIPM